MLTLFDIIIINCGKVEGPEDEISRTEIEKAIKQMRSNKAPGLSGITAEMIKAIDELGVDWYERVYERHIRETIHIHSNQFGFMPGMGTIDPFLFFVKCRRRFWKETENDTGHLWIWRKLLIESLEICYTRVYDIKELVRSL